jgi:hypothetical protein
MMTDDLLTATRDTSATASPLGSVEARPAAADDPKAARFGDVLDAELAVGDGEDDAPESGAETDGGMAIALAIANATPATPKTAAEVKLVASLERQVAQDAVASTSATTLSATTEEPVLGLAAQPVAPGDAPRGEVTTSEATPAATEIAGPIARQAGPRRGEVADRKAAVALAGDASSSTVVTASRPHDGPPTVAIPPTTKAPATSVEPGKVPSASGKAPATSVEPGKAPSASGKAPPTSADDTLLPKATTAAILPPAAGTAASSGPTVASSAGPSALAPSPGTPASAVPGRAPTDFAVQSFAARSPSPRSSSDVAPTYARGDTAAVTDAPSVASARRTGPAASPESADVSVSLDVVAGSFSDDATGLGAAADARSLGENGTRISDSASAFTMNAAAAAGAASVTAASVTAAAGAGPSAASVTAGRSAAATRVSGSRATGLPSSALRAKETLAPRLRAEPSQAALADAARLPVQFAVEPAAHRSAPEPQNDTSASAMDAASEVAAPLEAGTKAATVATIPMANDGRLTAAVNGSSVQATPAARGAPVRGGADGGVRERVRAAASEIADRRVLARGIDAAIDLGDAGRIQVRAENPDHRVDIRVDADVAHTARALAEHARELSLELRSDARDARVTVTGPSTHTTVSSNDTSGGRSGGGGDASSRREPGEQDRAPARDGVASVGVSTTGSPRAARRARFVL